MNEYIVFIRHTGLGHKADNTHAYVQADNEELAVQRVQQDMTLYDVQHIEEVRVIQVYQMPIHWSK